MLPVWSAISTVLSELRDKYMFMKTFRVHVVDRCGQRCAGHQFPGKGDLAFKRRPVLCNLARNRVDLFLRQITAGVGVNAGLKLLHSPERKYLSLTGIGLSIDPHSGVPPNSDAVVRGCGQTGGRCLGFRLCLTVGCV